MLSGNTNVDHNMGTIITGNKKRNWKVIRGIYVMKLGRGEYIL